MPPALRLPDRVLPHPGRHLGFTPAGTLVVAGGWPGRLTVFDPATGATLVEKNLQTLARFLAIAPDGSRLYTGEKTASGYALPRLTRVPALKGHRRGINGVAFSADAAWAVSVSGQHVIPPDSTLRVWDAAGLEVARIGLAGHGQQALVLDADHVLVGTAPARLDLIRLSTEAIVWTLAPPGEHHHMGPMALSADQSRLYVFSGYIRDTGSAGFLVLAPWTGQIRGDGLTAPPWKSGHCKGAAIHPGTGHLFASLGDNSRDPGTRHITVRQLVPSSGDWIASFGSPREQTGTMALSADGGWLAASLDEGIAVWSLSQDGTQARAD